jgi:hypothetical protein
LKKSAKDFRFYPFRKKKPHVIEQIKTLNHFPQSE